MSSVYMTFTSSWSILNILSFADIVNVRNDMKKNHLFIDEESNINENVRNNGIKKNFSKKVISKIDNTPEDRPVFDINTIDDMSLSELKSLLEKVNLYKSFDFSEDEDISTNQHQPVKMLKQNNK